MNKPTISIICAIAENRAIGKDNKLLWHIPEDLKRFKKLTLGHPVIMGRKTFESIGRPLPNRLNIIITKNPSVIKPTLINQLIRVEVCRSLEEGIDLAKKLRPDNNEIFIIGGGQIYQQAIKFADKLYLTIVEGNFEADTYFPDYSLFKKIIREEKGESEGYGYRFVELER